MYHQAIRRIIRMATQRQRALHLVLDFDGTLTRKDTTAILGSIPRISGSRPSLSWDAILKAYLEDYSAHQNAYTPGSQDRKTLAEEAAWLRSLRPIELKSVSRVEEAGVFRGVTDGTITRLATRSIASGEVVLRKGWRDLLAIGSPRSSDRVSILSVNWSRTFIRQILLVAAQKELGGKAAELEGIINSIAIHANEIEGLAAPTGSDGKLGSSGGIRTSGDKLECLKAVLAKDKGEEHASAANPDEVTHKPLNVYVGDSISDLECLVAADIGICIREEEMGSGQKELASCLERLAIDVRPLNEIYANAQQSGSHMWWTQDLRSIAEVLNSA